MKGMRRSAIHGNRPRYCRYTSLLRTRAPRRAAASRIHTSASVPAGTCRTSPRAMSCCSPSASSMSYLKLASQITIESNPRSFSSASTPNRLHRRGRPRASRSLEHTLLASTTMAGRSGSMLTRAPVDVDVVVTAVLREKCAFGRYPRNQQSSRRAADIDGGPIGPSRKLTLLAKSTDSRRAARRRRFGAASPSQRLLAARRNLTSPTVSKLAHDGGSEVLRKGGCALPARVVVQ